MHEASRRDFLARLGHGALLAAAGGSLVGELAAATGRTTPPPRGERGARPQTADTTFGPDLEKLIAAMQEIAPDALMSKLCGELRDGTALPTLVAAGAIANARAFGGLDYDGYHAQMALLPALSMSRLMPERLAALPVLKVLHRSSARIQATGGARNQLPAIIAKPTTEDAAAELQRRVLGGEMQGSEQLFRAMVEGRTEDAFDDLQRLIRDEHNVHRVVLAWRSFDVLPIVGEEHAADMLRQFVRFCVDHEQQRLQKRKPTPEIRTIVPKFLDQHRLLERGFGTRAPDDAFLAELADTVFRSDRSSGTDAVATALAEGFDPEAIAEAISLAANQLLLHDTGATRVHGASVGVHASDAANAWRHLARRGTDRPGTTQNRMSNLLAAACHTSGQSEHVGSLPYDFAAELEKVHSLATETTVLAALTTAIEQRDQRGACAAAQRYSDLELPAKPIFDVLLGYAASEDGALHAEKYFHTVHEDFRQSRKALRWRRVVALARVTASEFGERAPGYDIARELLLA